MLLAGGRRLANHIDRGGQVRASTGSPNLFQKLLELSGKHYGCALKIVNGNFDWKAVAPWMDADREIDNLIKAAHQSEKDAPEKSIMQYQNAIKKIIALDSNGPNASVWRTANAVNVIVVFTNQGQPNTSCSRP